MSPANGGSDRKEPVDPGDRSNIEERVRRALRAEADLVTADRLRPQPMSDLDELARRRQRSSWLLPVAVAATVAAVALLGILVPRLLDGPESVRTAASGSASNTAPASHTKTPLESLTSAQTTAASSSSAPPPAANDLGPAIQGPRGLVVALPTGWIQQTGQTGQNASCLHPSEAPSGGSTPCDKGVLISATEPGKQIDELVAHSCAGPSGSVDDVVADTRPAAGTTADYREFTSECGGAELRKAVWFIPSSQLAIVASGAVAQDPVTQKIVDSIDLTNYAALSPSESTASPSPSGAMTVNPTDVASRETTQRTYVTKLGYTPTAVAVDPTLSISCVIGTDASGKYTVFFFVDDGYVGTDSANPSTSVSAKLLNDTQAQVTYLLSDGTSVAVSFAWDGTTLAPTTPLPPTAGQSASGPYR